MRPSRTRIGGAGRRRRHARPSSLSAWCIWFLLNLYWWVLSIFKLFDVIVTVFVYVDVIIPRVGFCDVVWFDCLVDWFVGYLRSNRCREATGIWGPINRSQLVKWWLDSHIAGTLDRQMPSCSLNQSVPLLALPLLIRWSRAMLFNACQWLIVVPNADDESMMVQL